MKVQRKRPWRKWHLKDVRFNGFWKSHVLSRQETLMSFHGCSFWMCRHHVNYKTKFTHNLGKMVYFYNASYNIKKYLPVHDHLVFTHFHVKRSFYNHTLQMSKHKLVGVIWVIFNFSCWSTLINRVIFAHWWKTPQQLVSFVGELNSSVLHNLTKVIEPLQFPWQCNG